MNRTHFTTAVVAIDPPRCERSPGLAEFAEIVERLRNTPKAKRRSHPDAKGLCERCLEDIDVAIATQFFHLDSKPGLAPNSSDVVHFTAMINSSSVKRCT